MKSVYDFLDYRRYLENWLKSQPSAGRGMKRKLAEVTGLQPTYISIVFKGEADINSEHAHALNEFFQHDKEESRFFQLLVEYARAGNARYKKYLRDEIDTIKRAHLSIQKRLDAKDPLPDAEKEIYYSSWHYGAVRVALTVPRLQTLPALEKALQISESRLLEVLEFLVANTLAEKRGDRYFTTERATHIQRGSRLALQNHFNWRMKMIEMMPYREEKDVHFSVVMSLSKKDKAKLQNFFREVIAEFSDIVGPSKEEEMAVFCLDFQGL